MLFRLLLSLTLIVTFIPGRASATPEDAWTAANSIRMALFSAQGNPETALEQVETAQETYQQVLRPLWEEDLPEVVAQLDSDFQAARSEIESGRIPAFALLRGRIWTAMLRASTFMTLQAIEAGDGRTALSWLLLREFRSSTTISRPQTDASQEVYALIGGRSLAADVLSVVQAELLDTYQGKLNEALREADQANTRDFTARRSEEIGLAAGYFDILADVYQEQRGQEALETLQADFVRLIHIGMGSDSGEYRAAREAINRGLQGFVAAPLTDVELSRRAGQLLRFLAVVPIEYASAVRNGAVINDLEYQETLTFLANARSAFADLKGSLQSQGNSPIEQMDVMLAEIEADVRAYADPEVIQAAIFDATITFSTFLPSDWRSINSTADIQAIRVVLAQVKSEVEAGLYDEALSTCVHVYTILQESLEQKLLAFAPDVALRLDTLLWQGQLGQPGLAVLLATGASVNDIQNAIMKVNAALDEAEAALNAKNAPGSAIFNSAVIVFREGLEATLILIALVAGLRTTDKRALRRPIFAGAVLAGIVALLTWWLTGGILKSYIGLGAELEAVISLVSVAMMLLVTNWFFHRVYWTDHLAGFHARKSGLIARRYSFGLFNLGFASVYREGFETALFLQPLSLNAGLEVVLCGLLLGVAGVAVVGFVMFRLNARLPYKKMLIVTGILMGVVLLTLVGNTVYSLQIAGWMGITPISGVYFPAWMGQWLGVYPTWQGISLQIAAGVFTVGSFFLAERRKTQLYRPARETA